MNGTQQFIIWMTGLLAGYLVVLTVSASAIQAYKASHKNEN